MRLRLVLAVVTAGLATVGVMPATASTGVSIDTSRIAVSEELAPGGEYRLPAFGVRNPGDQQTSYVMVVSYVDAQSAIQPPGSWFRFNPGTVTLQGGQSMAVTTTLRLPPDAPAGEYAALIGPQIAAQGGGAQVGAGAAARLTFSISPCNGLDCWLRWAAGVIGEHLWVLLLALAFAALIAVRAVRRRFAFSIQRRPA